VSLDAFQQRVVDAARRLNRRHDLSAHVGPYAIITCATRGLEILEHVAHELAHGISLDLGRPKGKRYSDNVGDWFRDIKHREGDNDDTWQFCDANEVETHTVVMRVMKSLGLETSREAFISAAEMQMESDYKRPEVIAILRRFSRTTRCRATADEVLSVLLEEMT
jgi:hypothetical protein